MHCKHREEQLYLNVYCLYLWIFIIIVNCYAITTNTTDCSILVLSLVFCCWIFSLIRSCSHQMTLLTSGIFFNIPISTAFLKNIVECRCIFPSFINRMYPEPSLNPTTFYAIVQTPHCYNSFKKHCKGLMEAHNIHD